MAEERDPRVSNRYRELGAEEPPRALDEAILAASRRPARSWTQRWALPLSLAAVVVLSVTVTLRIQQEQPALESPAEVRAPVSKEAAQKQEKEKADKPLPRKEPAPFQPAPQMRAPAVAEPPAKVRDEVQAGTAAKAAAVAPAPAAAPASPAAVPASRAAREAESGAAGALAPQAAPEQALSKRAAETPERELERIAQLRRDGRHEEADKALAEFRKRHPDYRIPPEMLERVERR
jgi:outer membrane biosynthesis protein TonB